jgi:AAA+ ATPase superfamily predicted ATPase
MRFSFIMFVGRRHELDLIQQCLSDRAKAQLIVLYGRRRVGKSTLIRQSVSNETRVLYFEGIEGESTDVQIAQFLDDLALQTGRVRLGARTWREVFQGIGELVASGRWVLVFDEFPWMGAGRTSIVSQLKLYWDRWSSNPEVALFLCGSVASFMVKHVIHSKALHNRKTLELCLTPLPPWEAGLFVPKRSAREKAQLYMTLGGVPKYLEQIDPRRSIEQNLNRCCFTAGGFFINEYETLFKEQFRSSKVYEAVVAALAQAPASLSELSRQTGVARGGGFLDQLQNLVRAQFVREYAPVSIGNARGRRTRVYKLADPFLGFYFRYIHHNRDLINSNTDGDNLFRSIVGPSLDQYYGFSFERLGEVCMNRILQAVGLSLADVIRMGPYFRQARVHGTGLQIDWLVMRRDGVWNPIEFKYTKNPTGMNAMHEMKEKIHRLNAPDDVTVEPILVSAKGTTAELDASAFFQHVISLHDLMECGSESRRP